MKNKGKCWTPTVTPFHLSIALSFGRDIVVRQSLLHAHVTLKNNEVPWELHLDMIKEKLK